MKLKVNCINYLIKPKYRYADRILGRYIKLGNDYDFGIYNEFGEIIIPPEYSSIGLLYGKMFLTACFTASSAWKQLSMIVVK